MPSISGMPSFSGAPSISAVELNANSSPPKETAVGTTAGLSSRCNVENDEHHVGGEESLAQNQQNGNCSMYKNKNLATNKELESNGDKHMPEDGRDNSCCVFSEEVVLVSGSGHSPRQYCQKKCNDLGNALNAVSSLADSRVEASVSADIFMITSVDSSRVAMKKCEGGEQYTNRDTEFDISDTTVNLRSSLKRDRSSPDFLSANTTIKPSEKDDEGISINSSKGGEEAGNNVRFSLDSSNFFQESSSTNRGSRGNSSNSCKRERKNGIIMRPGCDVTSYAVNTKPSDCSERYPKQDAESHALLSSSQYCSCTPVSAENCSPQLKTLAKKRK